MTAFLKGLAKGLIATIVFFLVAEIAIRVTYAVRTSMVEYVALPYAFGDDYGPLPPWRDRLEILQNDDLLEWKNVPGVRRTYLDIFSPVRRERDRIDLLRRFRPGVPPEFRANPTWDVRINADGFRGDDWSHTAVAGAMRVACIGDSWTFGMPVTQDEAYPARLAAWLRQEQPGTAYDVRNYGVLGYSSFQGLQLLKSRVLAWHPDLVVIGFGMNDSQVAGYRDKDMVADSHVSRVSLVGHALADYARGLESYKLLKYAAMALTFRQKPVGEYLKAEAAGKGSTGVNYAELDPWLRVSVRDYDLNVREMIRLVREQGGEVVLVDNELWGGSPYRAALTRIADQLLVPLVDSLGILDAARRNIEESLASQLDLSDHDLAPASPVAGGSTTVVFRVYRGSATVPKSLSIVGTDRQLGALTPNTIVMHDDGTGGDERAGDGVWSYSAAFPPGQSVFYVYTNSGAAGLWEGLDLPHIRRLDVPASPDGRPVYLPIETFGRAYMQGDEWHTNAVGYDLIAHAIAREIVAPRQ